MFNATKIESLKTIVNPLNKWLKEFFLDIQQYLNLCNTKAIESYVKECETLNQRVNELEVQNSSIKEQIKKETSYFNNLNIILNNNKQPNIHV